MAVSGGLCAQCGARGADGVLLEEPGDGEPRAGDGEGAGEDGDGECFGECAEGEGAFYEKERVRGRVGRR